MSQVRTGSLDDDLRFEPPAGEDFSTRELRSNFCIINAATVDMVVPRWALEAGYDRVRLLHEDGVLLDRALDPGCGVAPPPGPGAPGSPATGERAETLKVRLEFLRGRNRVVLSGERIATGFSVPVFYKTPLRDWVESILKALIILITIQFFVVQTFFIPTGSMKETLQIGDYIMVEKVSYLFGNPQRGDVVVFQYPNDPRKDFIKRMVARAGDEVQVRDKRLIVNGREIDEDHVTLDETRKGRYWALMGTSRMEPHLVADDHVFVMGDNRDHSHDSRGWGDLPLFRVKGRGWLVYWPFRDFHLIRHEHAPFTGLDRR